MSKAKPNKKIILILCAIVLVVVVIAVAIPKNVLTDDEKYAVDIIEDYRRMMKDPDSLILRSDIIIITGRSLSEELRTYCFFTVSGNNSYGASVTTTECYVSGKYLCDTKEFDDVSIDTEDKDRAKDLLDAHFMLNSWNLNGSKDDNFISAVSVSADKVGRKLGLQVKII